MQQTHLDDVIHSVPSHCVTITCQTYLPLSIEEVQQTGLDEVVGWQHLAVHIVRPHFLEGFHQAADEFVVASAHTTLLLQPTPVQTVCVVLGELVLVTQHGLQKEHHRDLGTDRSTNLTASK